MKSFKYVAALVFSCLILQYNSGAQMRQVYLDNLQPANEIYKISFYSPSQGYVAFRDWIGYTADSGRSFVKKMITPGNVNLNGYSINTTFGFGIKGVKAFNQNTIIVYGDYGFVPAILYSNDGGNTYKIVYYSQFNNAELSTGVTDIIFPANGVVGYAIDADRILKTVDRGLSWSVVKTDPNSCFDHLDATDDNTIFAISDYYTSDIQFPNNRVFSNNKILSTNDGGSTWQTVSVPFGDIKNISFITPSTGWLNIDNSLMYTNNKGGFWTLKNKSTANPFNADKIKFVDAANGYALIRLYEVYKTTDSGRVWEPLPRDNNFSYLGYSHNDLQIFSASQLWAGGGHGLLELSTNAGGSPIPKAYFEADTTGYFNGHVVNLVNYSKRGYQYKWYVNNVLISTAYSSSYTHESSNQIDSIRLIVSSGTFSDTLTSYQYFIVAGLPVVTSFSPVSGSTGTFVILNGYLFTGATAISFGGVPAASFTVVNDVKITATLGSGATGAIGITTINGTSYTPGFTYIKASVAPAPTVTSVTPGFGPVGTKVVIKGSNFGSTIVSNDVSFGTTKALITEASANEITCTVPPGASFDRISLLNRSTGLAGTSLKQFAVTFADSSDFSPYSFAGVFKENYNQDLQDPRYVTGKDIDGDGKPDLLAWISESNKSIRVFRNTSTGGAFSFEPKVSINYDKTNDGQFDVADLDGDGKPDIAGTSDDTHLYVIKNNSHPGTISFAPQMNLPVLSQFSGHVLIVDLDNDGRGDLASTSRDEKQLVSFFRNTSSPGFISFAQRQDYGATSANSIAAGDLDGDGRKDVLILATVDEPRFICFRNTSSVGSISFASKIEIPLPDDHGVSIEVADYDNDNKLDVIVILENSYNIYRNISTPGNIAFEPVISTSTFGTSKGAQLSNLSGGIKPDIVTGNIDYSWFSVMKNLSMPGNILNNKTINISNPFGSAYAWYINTADFNMDGKPDVAISSGQQDNISIFKNNVNPFIMQTFCPGAGAGFIAGMIGTSYQWQMDDGTGFVDIAGIWSKTSEFSVSTISSSWTGYRFRCKVDETYGPAVTLKCENIWQGLVSNQWENPSNWSCSSVPDEYTDVVIGSGTVVLNSNRTVKSLKLTSTSNLTVNAGHSLTILH